MWFSLVKNIDDKEAMSFTGITFCQAKAHGTIKSMSDQI